LNKVILLGRLVADPETRYTQNNVAMSRFRIAVNRPGRPQEGQPTADFIQITAWRQTAEFVGKYFRKGQQILVEGHIRNNNWVDKDGNKRFTDEIYADQVYFADSRRDAGTTNTFGGSMPQVSQPEFQVQSPENGDGFYALSEDDEDLPF